MLAGIEVRISPHVRKGETLVFFDASVQPVRYELLFFHDEDDAKDAAEHPERWRGKLPPESEPEKGGDL